MLKNHNYFIMLGDYCKESYSLYGFQAFPSTKTSFLPTHSRGVPAVRAVRGPTALRHP